MEKIQAYRSTDGKLFATREEAIAYEETTGIRAKIDGFLEINKVENPEYAVEIILLWQTFNRKLDMGKSVRELGLSTRATNCLLQERITTVADLLKYSATDLLRVPNLGKVAILELKEVLKANGWYLSGTSKG